jgi:hypothetical protein
VCYRTQQLNTKGKTMSETLVATPVSRLQAFAEQYRTRCKEGGRDGYRFSLPACYGGDQGGGIKLTLAEYEELKAIMTDGKDVFIFEPFSMGMMDFSLKIYQRPVVKGAKPKSLFVIGGSSLPDEVRTEEKIAPGRILDDAFREYTPFSHTDANKRFLEQYNMETAHDFDHYDY